MPPCAIIPPSKGLGMADEAANRRRSERVYIQMPVEVRSESGDGLRFREETHTLVVNAHGGLLLVSAPVTNGQTLILRNQDHEQECRVVFVGTKDGEKTRVGVEFSESSPHFWRIQFPPADWQTGAN